MAQRETHEVRKLLSSKEAAPYIGFARKLLGGMKEQMQFAKLLQLSWTKTFRNGVQIVVSSVFGQDGISITVPIKKVQPMEHKTKLKESVTVEQSIFIAFWFPSYGSTQYDINGAQLRHWDGVDIMAVSADGGTVTGRFNDDRIDGAFRWTEATGTVSLSVLGLDNSIGRFVSFDGSTIIGGSTYHEGGFKWTKDKGAVLLAGLPANGYVVSAADDGNIILGSTIIGAGGGFSGGSYSAWLYTSDNNVETIGDFKATAISSDGLFVTGHKFVPDLYAGFRTVGVRWGRKTGLEILYPDPHPMDTESRECIPLAISEDGQVITGKHRMDRAYVSGILSTTVGFKWTKDTGVVLLYSRHEFDDDPSVLQTNYPAASDVSSDGDLVVGTAFDGILTWTGAAAVSKVIISRLLEVNYAPNLSNPRGAIFIGEVKQTFKNKVHQ